MYQFVCSRHPFGEPLIQMAEFEQEQIYEFDGLKSLIAIRVDQDSRSPIGDEEIIGAVAQMESDSFGDFLVAQSRSTCVTPTIASMPR